MSSERQYQGTIAVLHRGDGPCAMLADWLGAMREAYPGHFWVPPKIQGNQIARQRGGTCEVLRGHWVLFVDADVVPPFDALERLLAHDVPIVGGVYYERFPINESGRVVFSIAASRDGRKLRDADVRPAKGLMRVTSIGAGCMLIRREVFERLGKPYFRCGQIDPEYLMEDSEFCIRAKEEGDFDTYLDCNVRAGHGVEGVAWPGRDGRRWIEWVGPQDTREPAPEPLAVGSLEPMELG